MLNTLTCLRNLWKKLGRKPRPFSETLRAQLRVEGLESRLVPYSVSGNAWPHPELVTLSFTPDGTQLGGGTSDLFTKMNARWSPGVWQKEILRAAQTWAQQTNLNFAVVADNGAVSGSGDYQQGDPGFGDIRIGGFNSGGSVLASAYMPPPVNNYSIAGDFNFNTGQNFNIGTTYDLYTVALHEFGHSLGLYHSSTSSATMYAAYNGTKTALNSDDASGIRNIYSASTARAKDNYDAAAANETFSTASNITAQIDPNSRAALVQNLDITTTADVDYFKFTAPSGGTGSLTVQVQSRGLSLLAPSVWVYDSNQQQLGTASGLNQYGTTVTVTVNGITAGQTYYIKVDGADNTAFGTGRYALGLQLGTQAPPAVTTPNTQTPNGTPLSGGGGQAVRVDLEARANTTTAGVQQTAANGHQAVATDLAGNSVVVWASNQGGPTGWDIYAQRFDRDGKPQGGEFRVNTTTAGDQTDPTVARDDLGDFVVAWESSGQDGSGTGIYAQRFDILGLFAGKEFRVNTTTAGDQADPAVAMDSVGNTIITWSSAGQDGSGSGIYAQRYTALGLPDLGEFRVNATTAGDQTDPAVAMNRLSGDAVIAWTSAGQDGSGTGIYARRFSLLGLLPGAEFRVNATTAGDQRDPALAMSGATGDLVVTWSSWGQDAAKSWGIYARRYDAAGAAQGGEFRVNTTTAGDQTNPDIATDAGGNLLVTWTGTGLDGSGRGVFGQQFTARGEPHEGEFTVNTTSEGDQQLASVTIDQLGQAIVVWSGNGIGDDSGIFFQRYDLTTEAFDPFGHEQDDDRGAGHEEPDSPDALAAQVVSALSHSERIKSSVPAPTAILVESPAEGTSSTAAPAVGDDLTECSPGFPGQTGAVRDALFADLDGLADLVAIP